MNAVMTKADELAKKQRDISVSEFFEKNRHMLGFDNPRKALLTGVKEAVDNALDACEEAEILPEIEVQVIEMGNNRFRIIIEDNGPGIVPKQIPKIFAKLLYGSKFHSRKQSRGQQGIGISATVMYGQLTTGKAAKITSKHDPKGLATVMEVKLNTLKNEPEIVNQREKEWSKEHGTRIEIELTGAYQKGKTSIDEYIKEVAIVNPHLQMVYVNPKAEQFVFPRAVDVMPKLPKEIKPHPYGIELGIMLKMLHIATDRNLRSFLQNNFSRVSGSVADEIIDRAKLKGEMKPKDVTHAQVEAIMSAIEKTSIMAPPTDCIAPIGDDLLTKGLKKEVQAEFYCSVSRRPAVYRGNPFAIEVGIAYGGSIPNEGTINIMRFANKVPLLYQPGACAITKAVQETNWKPYGLGQSGDNTPTGPAVIIVHMASVWVPFTSEAKEAIAHYEDIIKEVKLGLQEAGRLLAKYTKKKHRMQSQLARANLFERYLPEVAHSLAKLSGEKEAAIKANLEKMIKRKEIQEAITGMKATNEEFDEDFASIGKDTGDETFADESEEDSLDGGPVDAKPAKGKKASGKKTKQKKLTE
jgi:DNA topoisomerase-6 subunit B